MYGFSVHLEGGLYGFSGRDCTDFPYTLYGFSDLWNCFWVGVEKLAVPIQIFFGGYDWAAVYLTPS
jgi:hypothetical protein